MNGIGEIQSRIQTIRSRVAAPPISGRFHALFAAEMGANSTRTQTPGQEMTMHWKVG